MPVPRASASATNTNTDFIAQMNGVSSVDIPFLKIPSPPQYQKLANHGGDIIDAFIRSRVQMRIAHNQFNRITLRQWLSLLSGLIGILADTNRIS